MHVPFRQWPDAAQRRFISSVRKPDTINELRELLEDAHRELDEQTRIAQYNRRLAESLPNFHWRVLAMIFAFAAVFLAALLAFVLAGTI